MKGLFSEIEAKPFIDTLAQYCSGEPTQVEQLTASSVGVMFVQKAHGEPANMHWASISLTSLASSASLASWHLGYSFLLS